MTKALYLESDAMCVGNLIQDIRSVGTILGSDHYYNTEYKYVLIYCSAIFVTQYHFVNTVI